MRWINDEDSNGKTGTREPAIKPENPKSKDGSRGLVKGEWIILLAVFIITGFAAFVFTRNILEEKDRYQGPDVVFVTPTPDIDNAKAT